MEYKESGFTHKDYKLLYKTTGYRYLRTLLREASYRDKRVQREIGTRASKVLLEPLESMPVYMTTTDPIVQEIVKWRLKLGR